MFLILIKLQSIIHMTFEFYVFYCHKRNERSKGGGGGGKINCFQSASLLDVLVLLCDWTFFILKNQSKRQAIELLFKVQISPDHPSSNKN